MPLSILCGPSSIQSKEVSTKISSNSKLISWHVFSLEWTLFHMNEPFMNEPYLIKETQSPHALYGWLKGSVISKSSLKLWLDSLFSVQLTSAATIQLPCVFLLLELLHLDELNSRRIAVAPIDVGFLPVSGPWRWYGSTVTCLFQ